MNTSIAAEIYWEHIFKRQEDLHGCLDIQAESGWRRWNRSVPQLLVLA